MTHQFDLERSRSGSGSVLSLFVLAPLALLGACSGGGSEPGIDTSLPPVETVSPEDLAGTVDNPLGTIQDALEGVLVDQIAANIPDENVSRFAELTSLAAIESIEVPEALIAAAAKAQELAAAGETNPEVYTALFEDAGLAMVADLRAAAETFAEAALGLSGGELAPPNLRELALAGTQATALANVLGDPASLTEAATIFGPLTNLSDAVAGLQPEDLLPEPFAGAPGSAETLAGLMQVLGQFEAGLGGAEDALDLIFNSSGVPQELTGPAQGVIDQISAQSGPINTAVNGLVGDNLEMVTRAEAATDLLFAALRAANAPDDPNTPLRLAQEGSAVLASLLGDLGAVLPNVACGILPFAPGCDAG